MLKHNPTSICQFSNEIDNDKYDEINITNFVYEPIPQECEDFEVRDVYVLYFVISGSCQFHTDYFDYNLKKGDFFIAFPKKRYKYDHNSKLQLLYISFSNMGAAKLLNKNQITYTNPILTGHNDLIPLFKKEFDLCKSLGKIDYSAKGLLYIAFSHFNKLEDSIQIEKKEKSEDTIKEIIKYINENYSDSELSLQKLSILNFYHFNYISQLFKKHTGTTFSSYLTNLRISKAMSLLRTTNYSIEKIATEVGFNDPHYFCRIFKSIKDLTPSQYRKEIKK